MSASCTFFNNASMRCSSRGLARRDKCGSAILLRQGRRRATAFSLAGGGGRTLFYHLRQDVALAQDLDLLAIDRDVVAGILAVDDFVALGHVERGARPLLQELARAD